MKNIKRFIVMNRSFIITKLSKIKDEAKGRVMILGPNTRGNAFWETINPLTLEFGSLVKLSPVFDIKPIDLNFDSPGFKMIKEIDEKGEIDTAIIVGNTTFVAGFLVFLHLKENIKTEPSLSDIRINTGQVLLINTEGTPTTKFL